MAKPQSVKVLEVCRVAPPSDLPNLASLNSLPLTFFDIFWVRSPPVERLFFYEFSSSNTPLFDSIIPKLKHSLSLTLQHYLPLAGNLVWPQDSHKPFIKYVDGDGVSLTIAESNMDFYHLSSNGFREATECHPLIPHLEESHERVAVVALQITLFPNSGFCIGVTSHHAVLDGKTSTSFVKSWAYICNKTAGSGFADSPPSSPYLPPDLTPFYDRAAIKDPAELEVIYSNAWLKQGGPNNRSLMLKKDHVQPGLVRATFELSGEQIQKLRNFVSADQNRSKHQVQRISTFSLVFGYTFVCLQRATETKEKNTMLAFSVDARSRLKPAIPPTYFGNCISGCFAVPETKKVLREKYGVCYVVEAISESIKGLENGVLNGAETWASFIDDAMDQKESKQRMMSVAGSPRFEVYSTDFGFGRPRKVEIASIDKTGVVSLSDSRIGNGGVEIGLVLNVQEMRSFASLFAKVLEEEVH
ncbi:phenolic glucoside malonyltransferase 1-like [Ziziphus jujuba]|uniref:Phenolic glucoside malonyltransferase 1-like n=1 Tax=Ziziphus jujuba TaxID=326968 RepID=A0ABM4A730_ZIZJJ|nr:phenolic glucoside malonyltransferase 1-like [Ziziphus jujuba]